MSRRAPTRAERTPRGWASGALLAAALGCAPTLPESFVLSRAAAERAYSAGRYEEAAEHWRHAAQAADRPKDRNEARYREAAALRRAGRHGEADALLEALARATRAARAPRASYDRALALLHRGDERAAHAELERLLVAHPDHSFAALAAKKLIERARADGGAVAGLAEATRLRSLVGDVAVVERLEYEAAGDLEALGRLAEARDRFLDVARRYPYPTGALWDDSLWHASLLEERLGDPRRAIAHLRRMLAQQEASSMSGSYERPRYSQARFRIAELYRDRLDDPARARREFRALLERHPTSLLVDDALWQEALLARRAGDTRAACDALAALTKHSPDSRYVACGPLLCPALTPPPGECRDYLRRSVP
ncbi:MAG: tetratricopeptide repeat protein [Polyangiaceae bacterium]|nr:tetratricopeptide repeat protein [Polyangiaceae bacterium]